MEINHPVAIYTDDPGVFDTTSTKEHVLLQKACGLKMDDLMNLILQSVEFAFVSDKLKGLIRERIKLQVSLLIDT
jgi:adenosine deaminase